MLQLRMAYRPRRQTGAVRAMVVRFAEEAESKPAAKPLLYEANGTANGGGPVRINVGDQFGTLRIMRVARLILAK